MSAQSAPALTNLALNTSAVSAHQPAKPAQLRLNIITAIGSALIGAIVMAAGYRIYLSYLGYELFGLWLVLSTIISITQTSNLGIGPALAKFVAEANEHGDTSAIVSWVSTATATVAASGAVAVLLLVGCREAIIHVLHLSSTSEQVALGLFSYVTMLSVYVLFVDLFAATLNGLGRTDLVASTQVLSQAGGLLISYMLLRLGFGINALLIGTAVSYLGLQATYLVRIRQVVGKSTFSIRAIKPARMIALVRFGGYLVGCSLIAILLGPANKLLLSRFGALSAVPIYDIAFNGAMRLRSFIEAGLRPLMPEVSRLSARAQDHLSKNKLRAINNRSVKYIATYGLVLYIAAFVAAGPFLNLWLRGLLNPGTVTCLRLIVVGTYLSLLGVPAFYILMGLGRTRELFIANVVQSGSNILIVGALIHLGIALNANNVLLAVAVSMGLAAGYLMLRNRLVLNS